MNNRIRDVRNFYNLSQEDFGAKLGVGRGVIINAELNRAEIKPLFIKHLCEVFRVNEEWIKSGNGEPFYKTQDSLVKELSEKYNLSFTAQKVIECYLALDKNQKMAVDAFIDTISETIVNNTGFSNTDDKSIKEYTSNKASKYQFSEPETSYSAMAVAHGINPIGVERTKEENQAAKEALDNLLKKKQKNKKKGV
ncbi:MAG: helix-turn-helix domain-containing protein [Oscillospiraceae bacterium]|jgi:transcriptional regulator with XRE-family HTH domain|nr:helix-turn-helix domain-containing protein [Oscillospiraceae bacterium]